MKGTLFTHLIIIGFFCSTTFSFAGDDFEWLPVTDADWSVSEDSVKGIRDAVMLFEKIIVNDTKLIDGKSYYSRYVRIKVLSDEGREWGDVTIPYINKKQKIEKIMARTILPDGSITLLDKSGIFEKEVFKTKGFKVKQKSFSLPAVSNDCIIEYHVKYRLPSSPSRWITQKDIYLLNGELVWKFYRGRGLRGYQYSLISDMVAPNYVMLNMNRTLKVEQRPSIKKPEEVVFIIENVAPFISEPHSMPGDALKSQVHYYYSSSETPEAFWGDMSSSMRENLEVFTSKNKRVQKVVESFDELNEQKAKIKTAYHWLQENIKNVSYEDDSDDYKDNNHLDDVLKRGYGSSSDINKAFYDMMREMNIDAKLVYVVDRSDNLFYQKAKYWQFDRSLVAIPDSRGRYKFYNPSAKYLTYDAVPWFNEGVQAFVVGASVNQFENIPFSGSRKNTMLRFQELTMDKNLQISGKMSERYKGHFGRSMRFALAESSEKDQIKYLEEGFAEDYANMEADSFNVENLEDITKPIKVNCNIKVSTPLQTMGNLLILKPYDYFSDDADPFQTTERKSPVLFDYASEVTETVKFNLSAGWRIESLPADTVFTNDIGSCELYFRSYMDGKLLNVQRLFKIKKPLWDATYYKAVQKLFQSRQAFQDIAVVLKRDEEIKE